MSETMIDIDDDALDVAARVLGTETTQETVNAALREIVARRRREEAFDRLMEMHDNGVFDDMKEPDFRQRAWGWHGAP